MTDPAHRLSTEGHAGDRGGDQQNGRDGEERVVGDRRAQAQCVIVPPAMERGAEKICDRRHSSLHSPARYPRTPPPHHASLCRDDATLTVPQ